MAVVHIELGESDLRKLVVAHLSEKLNVTLGENAVKIEVKSKQNWKSEWEQAAFRATINQEI